jgi:hypothetical protein
VPKTYIAEKYNIKRQKNDKKISKEKQLFSSMSESQNKKGSTMYIPEIFRFKSFGIVLSDLTVLFISFVSSTIAKIYICNPHD